MPRTIEGIMDAHQAAQQRRAQGRPIWDRTIMLGDVFHNEDMTFEERRDAIVARLRASGWVVDDGGPLDREVDDLAETIDAVEFDEVWTEIYDRAGVDRVWIDTISK